MINKLFLKDRLQYHTMRFNVLTEPSDDQPETCGVTITPGRLQMGLEEGNGSSWNTSKTAPPSHPLLKIRTH
jgi:hypothetical protein